MAFIMLLHICMGTVAVLAGAAALLVRKGSRVHRGIGNVFFVTMLLMAAAGIYLAVVLPVAISVLVGVFTIYLVSTSWMAAQQYDERINLLHYVALIAALGIAAGGLWFGLEAQNSPDGLKDGLPAFPHYFFGALALAAVLGDAVMIARRGINGKQRIARHLWRMCFAYFIAAGSLFTGPGATAFPERIRDTGILSAPEPIILAIMLFWIVRVLATRWYESKPRTTAKMPASSS